MNVEVLPPTTCPTCGERIPPLPPADTIIVFRPAGRTCASCTRRAMGAGQFVTVPGEQLAVSAEALADLRDACERIRREVLAWIESN